MSAPADSRGIHERIAAVMQLLFGVEKSSRNTHFNYAYAGHEAINAAMRPLFLKEGITQTVHCHSLQVANSVLTCMVGVRWSCTNNAASFVEGDIPALMPSSAKSGFTPQMAASLISYGCKGFALKALMLTDSNEPDAGSWQPEPAAKVDDTAEQFAVSMLSRFEEIHSETVWKEHVAWSKEHWGDVRGAADITNRFVAARDAALKRIRGKA
jgi:hypothetical protein